MGKKFPRRAVSGSFSHGVPFNPIGSDYDTLAPEGIYPYCAMLQIAEEDKYTDYVMCRGFDTRMRKFVDYEEGNANKPGIAVAKPYGNRVKCYYHKWSVYPCLLPTQQGADKATGDDFTPPSPSTIDWRVGQNPGKAVAACVGQTQASDDIIREMVDHNNNYVNWQLIDSGPVFIWVYLLQHLYTCSSARAAIAEVDNAGAWCADCEHIDDFIVSDPFGTVPNSALAVDPGDGRLYIPAGYNALVHRVMFPGETVPPRDCRWATVTFGTPDCCVDRSTLSAGSGSSSSLGPTTPCVFGDCSWIFLLRDQADPNSGYWTENTDTCSILTNCQCAQSDPPEITGTEEHGDVVVFPCEEIIPA